jgi:hypothetical protein
MSTFDNTTTDMKATGDIEHAFVCDRGVNVEGPTRRRRVASLSFEAA